MVVVRPLPGLRFEAQPPEPPEVLPRMDVAAFVGFAASGPIGVPVPVADPAGFAAIFGGDLPLAGDPETVETVFAFLPPSVRAFFRNGGRRCFVVRVADRATAASNTFDVPGLLRRTSGGLERATFQARSEGSWSDGLLVSAAESVEGLALRAFSAAAEALTCDLVLGRPGGLVPGDLLRIEDGDRMLLAAVSTVDPSPALGALGASVTLEPASEVWVTAVGTSPPLGGAGTASFVGIDGVERSAAATIDQPAELEPATVLRLAAVPPTQAPPEGALVRFTSGAADELWLRVGTVSAGEPAGCSIVGDEAWTVTLERPVPAPVFSHGDDVTVERVTFELRVEEPGEPTAVLAGLGFAPAQPWFAGALPTDAYLYATADRDDLTTAAAEPRFPLASGDLSFLVPLGMRPLADRQLGARLEPGSPLERDGLASFGASLFLDRRLAGTGLESLLATADAIRYGGAGAEDVALDGIHAVLGLDEVTLLAVPDAVHRGWELREDLHEAAPPAPAPAGPTAAGFADCSLRRLATPQLEPPTVDEAGTITLAWTATDDPDAVYTIEEARDGAWTDTSTIDAGARTRIELRGRPPGRHDFRVSAVAGPNTSDWSAPVSITFGRGGEWVLSPPTPAHADLLAVQRAALRLAAARGDLLVVLSLAALDREDAALEHLAALRSATLPNEFSAVPALDASEERVLSYGAAYHPWPTTAVDDAGALRRIPPDGAATGVLAARATMRGAWVAPANEPLVDVVALDPPAPAASFQKLQDGQLNTLRQEPRGFVVLSGDTLSRDVDLRSINVRRLLSLLRRVALRHGTQYIFEPNDATFRRGVQRGFEALLNELYQRGAFTGATPDQAFRVLTGDPPNTAQSVDEGQLVVELKVAPSLPLRFLTVRLVSNGERGLQVLAA